MVILELWKEKCYRICRVFVNTPFYFLLKLEYEFKYEYENISMNSKEGELHWTTLNNIEPVKSFIFSAAVGKILKNYSKSMIVSQLILNNNYKYE